MAGDRLKIIVECSKLKPDELELYDRLIQFSNPNVIIKEILLGRLPLSILQEPKND